MKTAAFYTLGCKLNFSETSTLKRSFSEHSFQVVDFEQNADVYVINTCSVTQDANKDCRKIVRRAQRQNPNAFIAVVGCYAQLEPEEIADIEGVDLVLGAKDKFHIFELVSSFEKSDQTIIHRTDVNEAVDFHHAFSSNDRTRAFLKVQDGCNYKCSFCTIPLARGKSRSPSLTEVVENATYIIDQGYQEIVVTGVNAGDFGHGTESSFFDLLYALEKLPGVNRIRISSIEPNLLSEDIIRLVADSSSLQPHFHIPLQSGSDTMLNLMRRRYRTSKYARKVDLIKTLMPDACIGVDVITGHPGETEELFREGFSFIDSLPVSYLHVFTYSERPNTHALSIEPTITKSVRKRRTHQLRRLSKKKKFDFDQSFQNQIRPVLFETEEKNGLMFGWTDNYIRVAHPFIESFTNSIEQCMLSQHHSEGYTEVVLSSLDNKVSL